MSEFVKETSEYVEMSDSITLCIVKDGAAGTSINMKTGVSSTDALPNSGANTGDSYIIDGHLWTYTGTTVSDLTHHNGFTDCGKVSGEAGKNNYVHVAWSNIQRPTKEEDVVLSNTDGKAYAYMGTWVSETKEDTADEAVKMAKWVYVKGDKGDTPEIAKLRVNHSALHYNPATKTWDYDSVTVSIVIFTPDGTRTPGNNDTSEYYWLLDNDTTTKRPSGWGFSATLEAASHTATLYKVGSKVPLDTITVPMVRDGKSADGKGALEILCDPETIVLDTDDNGRVTGLPNTNARAALMCLRDGKEVSGVTYNIGSEVNCEATVNVNGIVTITKVTPQEVVIDDGNTVSVSSTSGSVTVSVTVSGVTYTKTVPFTVNMARYTGGLKWDNKKLQSQYSLLTNDGNGGSITSLTEYKSQILQRAKEISLKVSEKSVGRRNMLVGSACRKYGDGFVYMCGQYYEGYPLEQIEVNSGIDGVNCIHCRTKQTGTDSYYLSGFHWNGGSPQGNIKLEKGKNYVLSFYAKTHTPNGIEFVAEAIYQGSNIDTTRPYGYDGPIGFSHAFSASEADKWELFTVKLSVPSEPKSEYVEICIFARARGYSFVDGYICKPMLEEGEEYNGWTLSEQDYDYVGGNLLDGTGTLTKTGNVETLDERFVTQGGYNNESASVVVTLWPGAANNDFLQYSTKDMGLKAGEDYMLSFYARSSGKVILQCYLYPSTGSVMTESSHEKINDVWNPNDGDLRTPIAPTTQWKRYWVHWRPSVNDPQHVLFRLLRPGTDKGSYDSSTSYNVGDVVLYGGTYYVCKKAGAGYTLGVPGSSSYWEASWFSIEIARPKLEVGATMTEWTEKRADMVDKRALLATGIDIDSKKITATADKFVVQNNSGVTTFGIDEKGNIVGAGDAYFKGTVTGSTINGSIFISTSSDGKSTTRIEGGKITTNNINANGGTVGGLSLRNDGLYQGTEHTMRYSYYSNDSMYLRGFRASTDYASTFHIALGWPSVTNPDGSITARSIGYANHGLNGAMEVVRQTKGGSNTLKLRGSGQIEQGDATVYEGDNECALGIRCGDSNTGYGYGIVNIGMLATHRLTVLTGKGSSDVTLQTEGFYVATGGITITMPYNPQKGAIVIIIQQTSKKVYFNGNGHDFYSGGNTRRTGFSDSNGQWNLFLFDGVYWQCTYVLGRTLW